MSLTLKSEIKQKTDCVCLYRNGSCLYTISKCKISSRKLQVNLEISSNAFCIGPSIGAGTGSAGPAIHSQPKLRQNYAFDFCVVSFPD